jgi:hypothetical protein
VVASYYPEGRNHDKIRLIVEIGSLHDRQVPSQNSRDQIAIQLHKYMTLLGDEGARWADTVLGVAILGTEVCFSRPRRMATGLVFTKPGKWYDLYDGTFVKEIDKVAMACKREDRNEQH